jgi:hypothetical protein
MQVLSGTVIAVSLGQATYSVFQKSLYRDEKSNSALLRTVIRVETCLNVLKHVSV